MAVYRIKLEQFHSDTDGRPKLKDVLEYTFASPGIDGPEIIKILDALPHYGPVAFVGDGPAVDIDAEPGITIAPYPKDGNVWPEEENDVSIT